MPISGDGGEPIFGVVQEKTGEIVLRLVSRDRERGALTELEHLLSRKLDIASLVDEPEHGRKIIEGDGGKLETRSGAIDAGRLTARREPDTASSPGISIVAGTVMLTAWSRILPETSAALSAVLMRMASSVAIFFAHLSSALSDAANTNASAIAPVLAVIFMTLLR
jgi:hypothetical protein